MEIRLNMQIIKLSKDMQMISNFGIWTALLVVFEFLVSAS